MKIVLFSCLSLIADVATFLDGEWEFSKDGGAWERVEVPHDWAIAGPFDPKGSSATGKLPWKGSGVYRRKFSARKPETGGAVWLEFDGVMARPEVFVTAKRATVRVEWETKDGRREKTFAIENPVLWSPDTPKLYSVEVNGREYRYGIRTVKFTAEDGFHLNGKRYQIKGANLHSDLGPLGMASPSMPRVGNSS